MLKVCRFRYYKDGMIAEASLNTDDADDWKFDA